MNRMYRSTALVAAGLLVLALNWWPGLDQAAETYLADAITDNLLIYATARSLNGIISVIQSVELSVSLGAGVAVHLGEILDPLNDLIERFSGFVLYGLAGLGLQKLVLVATASLPMKVMVSLVVIGGAAWSLLRGQLASWLARLMLLLLLVRFAFVIEVGVIAGLDALYFDHQQRQAHAALDYAKDTLGELRTRYLEAVAERGFYDGLWDAAATVVGDDDQDGVTALTASAITELIVIMLVRGLLLPLVFLWFVMLAARWLVAGKDVPLVGAKA